MVVTKGLRRVTGAAGVVGFRRNTREGTATMATKKIVRFVDDLDGSELDEAVTVVFGLNGKQYEFDTSPAHAKEFAQSLQKYLAVSRVANGSGNERPSKRAHPRTQAIRAWARENGYEISNRGRISSEIVAAFEAAV